MQELRLKGVQIVPYLDDFLLYGLTIAEVLTSLHTTETFLTSLGWKILKQKSNRTPSQQAVFLGYIIDTVAQKIFLPEDKVTKLISATKQLISTSRTMRRNIMVLLGLMSASIPAVQWSQLHIRALQSHLLSHWDRRRSFLEEEIEIPLIIRKSLAWWLKKDSLTQGIL